jgi:hypothetical protein
MKLLTIILTSLLGCAAWGADATPTASPEVINEFRWSWTDIEFTKWPWTGGLGDQGQSIGVEWHDKGPVSQTFRTLGSAAVSRITSTHYAIVGRLKYTNVSAGSYLEMLSYFAPEKEGGAEGWYFSRTLADAGPMAKLEGTDEGRDFILPFDASGTKTKLVRIVLNLHLGGPGAVELSDVKLVQYPDAPLPAAQAQSPVADVKIQTPLTLTQVGDLVDKQNKDALRSIWFCLGVAATGLFLLVGGGIIFVSRRWSRRRHERELRRIASLDS